MCARAYAHDFNALAATSPAVRPPYVVRPRNGCRRREAAVGAPSRDCACDLVKASRLGALNPVCGMGETLCAYASQRLFVATGFMPGRGAPQYAAPNRRAESLTKAPSRKA